MSTALTGARYASRMASEAWQHRPARPPVLDRDHLARLAAQIGAAPTHELLIEGQVELTDRLEMLAGTAGDPAAVADVAHQISGLAGTLGLAAMAHHAGRAADAARTGGETSGHLAALQRIRDPSLEALRGWCAMMRDADGA